MTTHCSRLTREDVESPLRKILNIKTIWTQSFAMTLQWPFLSREVRPDDPLRSLSTSFCISVMLWLFISAEGYRRRLSPWSENIHSIARWKKKRIATAVWKLKYNYLCSLARLTKSSNKLITFQNMNSSYQKVLDWLPRKSNSFLYPYITQHL